MNITIDELLRIIGDKEAQIFVLQKQLREAEAALAAVTTKPVN